MATETERVPPGLTVERVGFFTDAVFAIAMTLLVIDIPQPEDDTKFSIAGVGKLKAAENLLHFLWQQLPSFVSYVVAFFVLWIVWREHHQLFDRIERLSPRLVGLHFPTLLLIGFVPYATSVDGHYFSNPAGAALYTLAFGALLACRSAMYSVALRDGLLDEDVDLGAFRLEVKVSWLVTCYWFATLLLCWWAPWVGFAWALTTVVASLFNRLLRPRPQPARSHL